MDSTNKKACDLLLAFARGEKKNEVLKQTLCEFEDFEPYAAFTRLDREHKNYLISSDIKQFLSENNIICDIENIEGIYIKHYDYDNDGKLCYAEFLRSLLPNDQPALRTVVSQRPTYNVAQNERLAEDIEYTLAKLLESEIVGLLDLNPLKEELMAEISFSIEELFRKIDQKSSGFIDFENLYGFFKKNLIYPYEEEIISIIRRLDKDDDGRLVLDELIEGLEIKKNKKSYYDLNQKQNDEQRFSYKYTNNIKKEPIINNERIVRKEISSQNQYNLISKYSNSDSKPKSRINSNLNEYPSSERKGFNQANERTIPKNYVYTSSFNSKFNQDNSQIKPDFNNNISFGKKEYFKEERTNYTFEKNQKTPSKLMEQSPPQSYPYEPVRKAFSPMKDEIMRSSKKNYNNASPFRESNSSYSRAKTPNSNSQLNQIEEKLKRLEDSYNKNSKYTETLHLNKEEFIPQKRDSTPTRDRNIYKTIDLSPNKQFTSEYTRSSQYNYENKVVQNLYNLPKQSEIKSYKSGVGSGYKSNYINEGEKGRVNNDLKDVATFFQAVLTYEQDIERMKQELSIRPDFNLVDFFTFFDKEKKGSCNIDQFMLTLNEIDIHVQENEVLLFLKRFDKNDNGLIKFADFCEAFSPNIQEFLELLDQRRPINGDLQFSFKEQFSPETRRLIGNLLKCHFNSETAIEGLRKAISRKDNLNINEIFSCIDLDRDGYITLEELQQFVHLHGNMIKAEEAELILKRLDSDKDGRISNEEFNFEISSKLNENN